MKRRTLVLGGVSSVPAWLAAQISVASAASKVSTQAEDLRDTKRVFAHYMVAWPRSGPNAGVDNYIAEFRDAHQRGIDGFALNCGGWHRSEPLYRQRVLTMYRAAEQFGNGFKLFVSADGKAQDELEDIVQTTANLPAQLMVDGKPVISAYGLGGDDSERGEALIKQAESLGAYIVPHFMPSTKEAEIGDATAKEIAWRCHSAQGYFYFGAAGAPDSLARSIAHLATALKAAGKLFMAPVTPYYRGLASGTNYRAFETNGFSGMATEWIATIRSNVDWVQIVTWNDWAESTYVAPIGSNASARVYAPRFGLLPSHTGYLDASRYFIEWFKRGTAPTITQDKFYYFYRLHPVGIGAAAAVGSTGGAAIAPRSSTPLTALVHVTTFLTEPATLEILQGNTRAVRELPGGVSEVAVPALPGTPRFLLTRNGKTIADKSGEEPIRTNDFTGAFNYFSGQSAPD
ncbi:MULTISPECIES: endo-1,3-alpha-glucanase family glycosylhydrolase [Burkholderiaceae]|uniref:endo-1,3-alpha-glucanase family glycosylhydrolase n=1 Tax=Burkholderiaceae TaxID=119060 RepID=UPI0014211A77|nr:MULTISPECIES: endo-1,3-alpha-glucanase family glycosylhydrolase [Burkholderiaceae]MBN3847589.1 glycoside hydrolase family 71 [Paraburkholderia sp. Ac-20342]NIF53333.1 glycoside hydrolase family 71 [Burkholderia sp. Ax-1724]